MSERGMEDPQEHGRAYRAVASSVQRRLFPGAAERFGHYEVGEQVGRGSFGVVFKALDTKLGRRVAIKRLNATWSTPEGAARLAREAAVMARLSHPHVVQIHDIDVERRFIVMEYIDGVTLDVWLRDLPPVAAVRRVFRGIGAGIVAAHEVGVVHRDLKPANILVDARGHAKVTDFGLARDTAGRDCDGSTGADPDAGEDTLSRPGQRPGTPRYMAPEQHEGAAASPRSDQYSFSLMLRETLVQRGALTRVERRVLARGTATDPAQRWPDMPSLLAALERAVAPRLRRVGIVVLLMAALWNDLPVWSEHPAIDPCRLVAEEASLQARRWRDALDARPEVAYMRGFLDVAIDAWTADAGSLCTTEGSVRQHASCQQTQRELIETWVWSRSIPTTSASTQPLDESLEYWAARAVHRPCPEREVDGGDRRGVWAQRWIETVAALQLGQAGAALRRLDELAALPDATHYPAVVQLVRARALEATGRSDEAAAALHAAEDLAERRHDDASLLDARIEQTRLELHDAQRRAMYEQSGAAPTLPEGLGRVLDRAENVLQRGGGRQGEPHVRLLAARVDLALAAHAEGSEAAPELRRQCAQAVEAARHHGSSRLLALVLSRCAAAHPPSTGAALDALALAAVPAEPAVRSYLLDAAAGRAFARGEPAQAEAHLRTALALHEWDSVAAADLAYNAGAGLFVHGESARALDYVEDAVAGYHRHNAPLQSAVALQLRSELRLRGGETRAAVHDAERALERTRFIDADAGMWRVVFATSLVHALTANRESLRAERLLEQVHADLELLRYPGDEDQRAVLHLAHATLLYQRGRHAQARRALARLADGAFLASTPYLRAEAFVLRARIPGRSAREAASDLREATALYAGQGHDGAVAIRRLKTTGTTINSSIDRD